MFNKIVVYLSMALAKLIRKFWTHDNANMVEFVYTIFFVDFFRFEKMLITRNGSLFTRFEAATFLLFS